MYNSLAMKRVELLRLRVDTVWVSVVNGYGNGEKVQCQINLMWSKDNALELDQFELVFPVTSEGVSLSVYQLVPAKEASCSLGSVQLGNIPVSHTDIAHLGSQFEVAFQVEDVSGKDVVLSQGSVSATFSRQTGLLKSMSVGGVSTEVKTDFVMYSAAPGRERSGAYLFLPAGEASSIVSQSKEYRMRIVTGPLVGVGLCSRRGSSNLVGVSVQCWIVAVTPVWEKPCSCPVVMQVNEIHSFIHEDVSHRVILENIPGKAPLSHTYSHTYLTSPPSLSSPPSPPP